ncbi:MAG: DUF1177 domain-containing protein [archaeon]
MLKQVVEVFELLDDSAVDGSGVEDFLRGRGADEVETVRIQGESGSTDFVKATVRGRQGASSGGDAPTLGIIGRLGGIGARPDRLGIVSDADGAVTAVSCALKLADMKRSGDVLSGDVMLATHICPNAPVQPHKPVPFMGSPVDMATMNRHEVDEKMQAILSVDTTKGNRIAKFKGIAITPTVKQGYILKVSNDLLDILEWVTGQTARVVPITTQDITPYGNDVYHLNSIMQPSTVTSAPVVGVAVTSDVLVPGCATGASHVVDIELAARFCLEVAKAYTAATCSFYEEREFENLLARYGSLDHLSTLGRHGN